MPRQGSASVRFEGLAFQVEAPPRSTPKRAASGVLGRAFPGETWTLKPLNEAAGEFEAIPVVRGKRRSPPAPRRGARPRPVPTSVAGAWNLAYRLRDLPEVVYAEPLFEVEDDQQHPPGAAVRRGVRAVGREYADPGTAGRYEWSIEKLRVKQAWALFDGATPGKGVVVGHPDTGYTAHPEIQGSRLRVADGYDFEADRQDPADPLDGGFLQHPGHGTSTSSLIISAEGPPSFDWSDPEFVSGVAPGASLIPIRTTRSVVLWSMSRLTRSIRHAIEKHAHVISISLGGPAPSVALHNAVRDAERAGIIVLCAAGNQVRFVVFPAAFDEVIAVAASQIDDSEWPGSCRGPAVDITAPGSSVWRARAARNGGTIRYSVERGSGTSYAVAQTAGLAALWLSYHGRQTLIQRYGRDRLSGVFKQLLQETCRMPRNWDTRNFGPGIAHAEDLLGAPLPAAAPARGLRGFRRRAVPHESPLEVLVHQLVPAPRSGVERVLSDLLNVPERALPEVLDDVGLELAMQIGVDAALRARLRSAAEAAAPGARVAARRRPADATTRRQLEERSMSRRLRRRVRAARRAESR